MPAPTKKDTSNSDVTFAQSLLYLNNSTRNLQSWLPSNLQDGSTSAEKEVESDFEGNEDEGGLGYSAPKSSSANDRKSLGANEKLRKQLLGNRASQSHVPGKTRVHATNGLPASKPRPQTLKRQADDSDDDVEGRTSTTSKKSASKLAVSSSKSDISPKGGQNPVGATSKTKKTTYLDELLAQRKSKKIKKQSD